MPASAWAERIEAELVIDDEAAIEVLEYFASHGSPTLKARASGWIEYIQKAK